MSRFLSTDKELRRDQFGLISLIVLMILVQIIGLAFGTSLLLTLPITIIVTLTIVMLLLKIHNMKDQIENDNEKT